MQLQSFPEQPDCGVVFGPATASTPGLGVLRNPQASRCQHSAAITQSPGTHISKTDSPKSNPSQARCFIEKKIGIFIIPGKPQKNTYAALLFSPLLSFSKSLLLILPFLDLTIYWCLVKASARGWRSLACLHAKGEWLKGRIPSGAWFYTRVLSLLVP